MAVEPFQFIGEKLVQRQSKMLKHKLVEVNAPTFSKTQSDMVSEVFLGIGNHTSLVSTQTLIYKLYSISRKYCGSVIDRPRPCPCTFDQGVYSTAQSKENKQKVR